MSDPSPEPTDLSEKTSTQQNFLLAIGEQLNLEVVDSEFWKEVFRINSDDTYNPGGAISQEAAGQFKRELANIFHNYVFGRGSTTEVIVLRTRKVETFCTYYGLFGGERVPLEHTAKEMDLSKNQSWLDKEGILSLVKKNEVLVRFVPFAEGTIAHKVGITCGWEIENRQLSDNTLDEMELDDRAKKFIAASLNRSRRVPDLLRMNKSQLNTIAMVIPKVETMVIEALNKLMNDDSTGES